MPARTTIDAARCRELLAKGLTQTQVAARLGVSVSKVSRVAKGVAK
jgi:transcriptional regulator with XRE-family HTH domain